MIFSRRARASSWGRELGRATLPFAQGQRIFVLTGWNIDIDTETVPVYYLVSMEG